MTPEQEKIAMDVAKELYFGNDQTWRGGGVVRAFASRFLTELTKTHALVPREPTEALRYQRQCDEDGTEIAVPRQAVDELLAALEAFDKELR